MTDLVIYENKKFDINKIIKMVFKRKDWGKKYTLYKLNEIEVGICMDSFNFNNSYATFRVYVDSTDKYTSDMFNVYINREDYTLEFVNRLLLKTVVKVLNAYRKEIATDDANEQYHYIYSWNMSKKDLIELLHLDNDINAINDMEKVDDDTKELLIENLIDSKLDDYNDKYYYIPLNKYVNTVLESESFVPSAVKLIANIKNELNEE